MALVQEIFNPLLASASIQIFGNRGGMLGGFICSTAGTITLALGTGGVGAAVLASTAVVAGQYLPLPFAIPPGVNGLYATLDGGCTGTFAII